MALNKRTYTDEVTIITAENLNEIQDHIIALESNPVAEWGAIEGQISDQEDLSAELSGKEKTISKQTGAPASPTEGDLWLDTDAEETLSANDVGYDATETYDTGTVGAVISAQSSQIETISTSVASKADAADLSAEVTRATTAEAVKVNYTDKLSAITGTMTTAEQKAVRDRIGAANNRARKIATITTTEDGVSVIEFTVDDDGNPFSIQQFVVVVNATGFSGTEANNVVIGVEPNFFQSIQFSSFGKSYPAKTMAIFNAGGYIFGIGSEASSLVSNASSSIYFAHPTVARAHYPLNEITKVRVRFNRTYNLPTAGTEIILLELR